MLKIFALAGFGDFSRPSIISGGFGEMRQLGLVTQKFLDRGSGIRRFKV